MTSEQSSKSFKLSNFRHVDGSGDATAYIGFLDRFAAERREMIDIGIDLLELRPGSAILDVGCGHGATIPMLALVVGASGRVVGIEPSLELMAEARRRFGGSGLPVEISVGNAQTLNYPDATFDAARTDRVLVFVPDVRAALLELVRVTKPGGRVVVTEPDMAAAIADSSDQATTREVLASVCGEFQNPYLGRQLRSLFRDAGLKDAEARIFSATHTNFAIWKERMGIDEALRTAIESGRVSTRSGEAWLNDLHDRDASGRFFAANMLCMVSGTKPKKVEGVTLAGSSNDLPALS
ncbi:MAG: methyltransferase domain-containing protein [Burkholderiales bacterium]